MDFALFHLPSSILVFLRILHCMTRTEHSAGFIVFVEPDRDHPEREFLLRNAGRHWDYPKGHVEKGEDDLTAARRELAEETGIVDVEVIPDFKIEIEYFFRHSKHGLTKKTVKYFLGRAKNRQAQISHEHTDSSFLPAAAALKQVTFSNSRHLLQKAIDFLGCEEK